MNNKANPSNSELDLNAAQYRVMSQPELGNYRDNEAAFGVAQQRLLRGTVDAADYQAILHELHEHILRINDPKSTLILLPKVEELLNCGEVLSKSETVLPERQSAWNTDKPITGIVAGLPAWSGPIMKSLRQQASIPVVHLPLVLLVLSFNVVVAHFLNWSSVEIKRFVEPVLQVTDVLLVTIVCAEAVILLTMTVCKEVLEKVRDFGRNDRGSDNADPASAASDRQDCEAVQCSPAKSRSSDGGSRVLRDLAASLELGNSNQHEGGSGPTVNPGSGTEDGRLSSERKVAIADTRNNFNSINGVHRHGKRTSDQKGDRHANLETVHENSLGGSAL
jgi:hypothetical protein